MKTLLPLFVLVLFANCNTEVEPTPITTTEASPITQVVEKDPIKNKLEWLTDYNVENTLINRIAPPEGFYRESFEVNSFEHWIRRLPLKEGNPKVKLYNGAYKGNQEAHAYVFDLDVGERDLQQCADATMRIRAEYLYHTKQYDKIHFNYTNGALVPYSKWRSGLYPIPKGSSVSWVNKEQCNTTYSSFKAYLIQVFNYAGTQSLSKELTKVSYSDLQIGDLLIKGGFPGHAVMVVDLIENKKGEKKYLLAQSYMPAQDFQLLKSPDNNSPWYDLKSNTQQIKTPEWTFESTQLMRWN